MADHKGRGTARWPGRFMAEADADLVRALRAAGHPRGFERDDSSLTAGTMRPDGPILLISTGFVAIEAAAADGRRTLLSIRGPGDLAGERALFHDANATLGLTLRPLTGGSAFSVPQDRFRRVLTRHPQGWAVLARTLHNQLAAAEERISLRAGSSASQRLAAFLLQLLSLVTFDGGARCPAEIPVPLTQAELGEWIGSSREHVERVLAGWAGRGVVKTGRRSLVVSDVAFLERIAGIKPPGLSQTA